MDAYQHTDVTDKEGKRFRIEHHYDHDMEPPWESAEGHGVVSDWTRRNKRPGELILNRDGRGWCRFYDFQASIKIARRDSWNSWNMLPTAAARGEELVRAVMMDFHYLRDWCQDKWHYMGIMVFPLTNEGDQLRSKQHSLWGIESESDSSYFEEVTNELLAECGAELH